MWYSISFVFTIVSIEIEESCGIAAEMVKRRIMWKTLKEIAWSDVIAATKGIGEEDSCVQL